MNIINFIEIDSTNTYAKKNIETLTDKTIISAAAQTNGYGRFDRSWVNVGEENIYMTIVLKPKDVALNSIQGRISESPCDAEINSARRTSECLNVYSNLTQYLSVCLCKQLEEMGMSPQIKWPNDVLLSGKKVCGILAESIFRGGKLKGIVLGAGINLNASETLLSQIDRPATSVNIELGQNINKQEFMEKLLEKFFEDYDEFLENGFLFIKADYEKRSTLVKEKWKMKNGKEDLIKIAVFDKVKEGTFKGFGNDGTLILLMPDGTTEKINMGEIV